MLWRGVLLALLIPLAFIAFWPSPVDQPVQGQLARVLAFLHSHGMPRWFTYKFVEAAANVALFMPFGFAGLFAFPALRWWRVGTVGLLISCCMELGQLLFLDNRFANPVDLITNTSGSVIGAFMADTALEKLQARRLPVADL